MTIQARYSGVCPDCGGKWRPGDLIRTVGLSSESGQWRHAHCPEPAADPVLDKRPGEKVCTTCWLIHPEGACDR